YYYGRRQAAPLQNLPIKFMSTKLILIRHGQTDWSKQKKYCGVRDIDLNDVGRHQAEKLENELINKDIINVYSSDLKRCENFAKLIFKNKLIEKLPQLREMNFGIFEGLTYHQLMEKHQEIYQRWLNNPSKISIPQGENLNEMNIRVKKTLMQLLCINKDKTIAMITHGGPIKVILCHVLNLNLDEIWQIEPGLASVREIEFDETGKGKIL
ncbi:MAG: histidine phosphatase family protein, partial [Candidatus Omnitrophica bacterium]|nr:histidine phosphatase family protein [Candidatus Omnitrophota bacterium]